MPDQQDRSGRPHRPVPHADLTDLIDAARQSDDPGPEARAEVAAATAAVVLAAGRKPESAERATVARLVALADTLGLDTLAALWRDADPVSLPGALWALYLLRQWCRMHADDVTRLWRAGSPYAQPDAVVAGVGEFADAGAMRRFGDDLLSGAYRGDFDVALERASAFFRVIASGRRDQLRLDDPPAERDRADHNDRAAADLAEAATRWRKGTLQ
ncbi:MAG: hypothetical protein ABJB98_08845 [Actinomycetota bacterium]